MIPRAEATFMFVGADGSLGYRHGQVYNLRLIKTPGAAITIERVAGGGLCPYESLVSFSRNWKAVPSQSSSLSKQFPLRETTDG